MEKIWEALKEIDAKADQIRIEAAGNAKEIATLAQKQAEELVANSKAYAEEEAKRLFGEAVEEANRKRDEQLKINEQATQKMSAQAQSLMEQAVSTIVQKVLGEKQS